MIDSPSITMSLRSGKTQKKAKKRGRKLTEHARYVAESKTKIADLKHELATK